MTEQQTACKTKKYMYSKCEDIHCRSVAPMQDTPAERITYEAFVTVPNGYDVRMSANRTSKRVEIMPGKTEFRYQCNISIPSYLIAMAVGDLEYRELDHRTGVITEPCRMNAVAWELMHIPKYLDAMEKYLTPYVWGVYNLIVMPPSFPSGAMENPLLTFASPSIITGDRSLLSTVVHEIAHSWSGNLVTCENWSNLWINEGFTVFEERKILAQLYGIDFVKVNSYLGN